MARRLAIVKKTKLDEFDGWEGCYVTFRPVTYGEQAALSNVDENDQQAVVTAMLELVKSHVISGKVKILKDDGSSELADLENDDIDQMSQEMVDKLFADMTGVDVTDPKVLAKAAATTPAQSEPAASTEN